MKRRPRSYLDLPQFPAMSERRLAIAEKGAAHLAKLAKEVAELIKKGSVKP